MAEIVNDLGDGVQSHPISRFPCRPFGHRASIAVDAAIGRKEQVRIVQQSIDAL